MPFTDEYRWHWVARAWRMRGVGELMLATINRFATTQIMRQATPKPGSLPEVVDEIHRYLDGGTKRAILQLYRDADEEKLATLGRDLKKLQAPALVLWGDADPYLQPRFGDWYGQALGGETRVEHLPDAGHWTWVDRPDVIDKTVDFLTGRLAGPPGLYGRTSPSKMTASSCSSGLGSSCGRRVGDDRVEGTQLGEQRLRVGLPSPAGLVGEARFGPFGLLAHLGLLSIGFVRELSRVP